MSKTKELDDDCFVLVRCTDLITLVHTTEGRARWEPWGSNLSKHSQPDGGHALQPVVSPCSPKAKTEGLSKSLGLLAWQEVSVLVGGKAVWSSKQVAFKFLSPCPSEGL